MVVVYGKLEEYNNTAESWRSYMERVEEFFDVNEVPVEKRVKALLSSIGGKTYTILRKLTVPDRPSTKTIAEIDRLLSEHFHPAPLIIGERFRFHKRDQKPNESVPNYIAALRELSEHCAFGTFLNEALRDRFVCGLYHENIQTRLLSERNLTLERAVEIANAMDIASHDVEEFQGKSSLYTKKISYREKKKKGHGRETPENTEENNQVRQIKCYRCGSTDGHKANECRFINSKCLSCGKIGHLRRVCLSGKGNEMKEKRPRARNNGQLNAIAEARGSDSDTDTSDYISMVKISNILGKDPAEEIWITPEINNVPVKMEFDSGSPVGIMPEKLFNKYLADKVSLTYSPRKLVTYNNSGLDLKGIADVTVCWNKRKARLPLYVTTQGKNALMGREWLNKLCPNWCKINSVSNESIEFTGTEKLQNLLQKHKEIFEETLGKIPNIKARICMKKDTKPVYCKARTVPYSLRPRVENELLKLEEDGIITKIKYSEWATPIVPVVKPDGSVRICGDFKTTVNANLVIEQYPLPRIEDLFANLAGGKLFSKIDLKQAYHQMELDEESKTFMVINTGKGLYRYNRLVFGISSAPAIWQRTMEQILQGIKGIQILQDDILITGRDTEEHFKNLQEVLRRIKENGLRVNKKKCKFFEENIEFCGHRIDAQGLHKTDEKIKAVQAFSRPKNTTEVRSFLGLVNYYGKFIQNASMLLRPLNKLLEKQKEFSWTRECDKAFQTAKEVIASDQVLIHYDPKLPLRLDCDASQVGLGCVLSHVLSDGTDRPIAYASRTLTTSEKNYAQIDKEALSIVWAIKKFNIYLYGRHFNLVTDHEPLTSIFHPHKAISVMTAARLQRYAIFLGGYNYDITYRRSGNHGNADGLSRLPLQGHPNTFEKLTNEALEVLHLNQINVLPVSAQEIRQETTKDPIMSQVYSLIQQGWGSYCPSKHLTPYFTRRNELTIQQGIVLWGIRVVIPPKLQDRILEELHSGHIGIVKMKSLARSYVWWPGMDEDIQEITRMCSGCRSVRNMPEKAPLHSWEYPTTPWERVHVDFAGPFLNKMFLVLQDAHSKWPETVILNSSTSEKTIEALREIFARNGLPIMLVTDNGTQFSSEQFKRFMKSNGIKHHTSPPYHPATNGLAERFVETLKNALKSMKDESELTLNEKVSKLLMAYRNSPHSTTRENPSVLFFNRHIRTRLDLIKPELRCEKNKKVRFDGGQPRCFDIGQTVLARGYQGQEKWLPGKVVQRMGPLTYIIKLDNGLIWRRHIDQLLESGKRENRGEETHSEVRPIIGQPVIELSELIDHNMQSEQAQEETLVENCERDEPMRETLEEIGRTPEMPMKRYPARVRRSTKRLICEDI